MTNTTIWEFLFSAFSLFEKEDNTSISEDDEGNLEDGH